jgi:hypothetical protein
VGRLRRPPALAPQPVPRPNPDTDWNRTATDLDAQPAKALSRGGEIDRKMAAAIKLLKNRVDQRRASVRGKN